MKQIMNRWLLLFILLLGMPALACNLPFGGEEEPTPRPTANDNEDSNVDEEASTNETDTSEDQTNLEAATAAPEATTETEVMVEETPESDNSLFSGLFPESLNVRDTVQEFDTLDSYQMEMAFSTTVSETTQTVQATILISTDPAQSKMTFAFAGYEDMAGMDEMSMTQIEGTTYMNVPEFGCITTSEADLADNTFSDTLDANQFLEDIGEATLVGEETINDIETLHYTFDETVIADEMTQFNWAQGDVYIAKEGNYVVRFRLEGEGSVTDLGLVPDGATEDNLKPQIGLIIVEMNLSHINEPVNISVPEGCENSGTGNSDYPVLDDAYESSSFGGIVTYKTETAFADAVAFYQEALVADGWVYQESDSFILEGSTALMYFDQDDRSLTVTISQESGTTAFLVVIFEE